ncbi:MAG: CoB--CoM heterodisulfide reductase subunit B, partial [Candidatus Thorarchaeota archaeon]
DVLVDVCSFCHLQFEVSQPQLNKELGENRYQLPVMYYTQLLGLAMGLEPDQLGLNKHVVSTKALLDRILG